MVRIKIYALVSFLSVFLLYTSLFAQVRFSFVVTSDQRKYAGPGTYDSSAYFRGAIEAINNLGRGAFMISVGDIDPPFVSKWTIEQVLDLNYQWYPVVGNHELPGAGSETYHGANMEWLRAFNYDNNDIGTPPDIVNPGPSGCPETTYSFDYENVHFVVINEYCTIGGDDLTDGDIPDHLYNWLVNDLASTKKEHTFIFGHEPAHPQPDADNGRAQQTGDSLNKYPENRDRFWNLLKEENVVAYFCGHTHNFSAVKIDGIWQLDSGHARGDGDTGAPSTFIIVQVNGSTVNYSTYRDTHDGFYDYNDIIHSGVLKDLNLSDYHSIHNVWIGGGCFVATEVYESPKLRK